MAQLDCHDDDLPGSHQNASSCGPAKSHSTLQTSQLMYPTLCSPNLIWVLASANHEPFQKTHLIETCDDGNSSRQKNTPKKGTK
jgi:hypothetical protein